MIKKNIKYILISLLVFIPMLIGIYYYNVLPEILPTRFNFNGEVEAYTNKRSYIIYFPLGMFILSLFNIFFIKSDPKNRKSKNKIIGIVVWVIPIMTNIIMLATFYSALNKNVFNISIIIKIFIAISFIIIGNYLPKTNQNYTIGIRTPWSLNNEENWNKTHRLGGKIFILSAVLILISIYEKLNFMIVVSMGIIIIPIIYSYYLYHISEK